jgi:3',5'-cyclic AMP phosphodiesterase CpdA
MASRRPIARELSLVALLPAACLEYSPHALPTDRSERDLNHKAIERLVAAPPPGPLAFAVVGDTQRSFDEAEEFVAAVNAREDVQFVVQVGDFTNVGILLEFELMNEIFSRLRVPYLVVVGFHDQLGNGARIYAEMFGPENFAFTLGRTRLVLYDSNSSSHDFAGTVPDLAWLEAALAPGPDHDRVIAFSHIAPGGGPLFDEALTLPLLALLARSGTELSLHGHAHRADAFEREGVRIVIADSVDHRSWVLVTQRTDGGFDYERVFF